MPSPSASAAHSGPEVVPIPLAIEPAAARAALAVGAGRCCPGWTPGSGCWLAQAGAADPMFTAGRNAAVTTPASYSSAGPVLTRFLYSSPSSAAPPRPRTLARPVTAVLLLRGSGCSQLIAESGQVRANLLICAVTSCTLFRGARPHLENLGTCPDRLPARVRDQASPLCRCRDTPAGDPSRASRPGHPS